MSSTAGPIAEPPAVVHLVSSAVGRGAQRFARDLVDALGGPAAGHRLVSLFDGDADVPVDAVVGVPGGATATGGLRPGTVVALRRWLGHHRPDVVVAHGGNVLKYAALVSPVPVVAHAIGTMPEPACRGLRRRLWQAATARAWVVVAVSDDVALQARTVLGVGARRLVVVPNGRDPDRFRPSDGPAGPAGRGGTDGAPATGGPGEAGTPGAGPTVTLLFVGRLTTGKRPDRFVALVDALRRRGMAVRGRMVGDGPLRQVLAPAAAAAGIEMVGHCADVVPHLQQADVLVFPSAPSGEGMPGVLIEAGLCGLPVVTTDVPGASAVVADGRTGLVVPVDDTGALLAAVVGLAGDPWRRRAMGAAARQRCCQELSLARSVAQWHQVLADVVAGTGIASGAPAAGRGPRGGAVGPSARWWVDA